MLYISISHEKDGHYLKVDCFPLRQKKCRASLPGWVPLRFCLHAAALTAASGGEVSDGWGNHPSEICKA